MSGKEGKEMTRREKKERAGEKGINQATIKRKKKTGKEAEVSGNQFKPKMF